MKNFRYIARSLGGQRKSGTSQALSRQDVLIWLRDQGLIPVEVEEAKVIRKKKTELSTRKIIKSADLASFCWQLRAMIERGIPINTALKTISEDCKNKYFHGIVNQISENVKKGETLSDSVAQYPKVFNKLFQTMISAGEKGGDLSTSLARMADYFDNRDALVRKIKAVLAYPAFLVGFIIFLIVLFVTFIIPGIKILFDQMGGDLPAFTQAFIGGYDYLVDHMLLITAIGLMALFVVVMYFRTRTGWAQLSIVSLKAPLFGKIISQAFIAIFCRTFATLLSAGISVLEALEILSTMSRNTMIQSAVRRTREHIVEGSSISLSMAACGLFPNILIKMVEVGEESGSLPEVLESASRYYEKKSDSTIKTAMALLEPILIVSVCAIVLGVVLAICLPVFTISDVK